MAVKPLRELCHKSMEKIECAVIGAGVIGLAVARALAAQGREVLILEAENAFGTGLPTRRSGADWTTRQAPFHADR